MNASSRLIIVMASMLEVVSCEKKPTGVPAGYLLSECVISGEKLGGEMGSPVKVTHEGVDVYLCCESCIEDFQKDPARHTRRVKDAKK